MILLSLSLPASLTLLVNLPPVSPCSIVDLDTMYSDYHCPLVVNYTDWGISSTLA